jgi:nucleoside-diphosphate-sugar epimerase
MLTHRNPAGPAPSRVVVLGARGFLAARLICRFEREGIACRPVGSAEVDLTAGSAPAKLTEILQPGDALVVTSALTPEHGRDRATFLKNVAMIDHLCAALSAGACAHIVYVSSDSVYDSRFTPIQEETPCDPADLYALAHIVREKFLSEACQSAKIPLAIVRPCAIYGAGDTHDSYGPNRFLRTARAEGKIVLFGQGEEERDHVYIEDVVRIVLECLLRGSTGVINAASGSAVPFHEVARKIAEAIARPVAIETAPRRVPIVHKRFDPAALLQAFPSFEATSLEAGIRQLLAQLPDGEARFASRSFAQ